MRLFLDANVLFSAAQSAEGRARGLFFLAEKKICVLVTSEHAVAEARRNLTTKKPTAAKVFEKLLKRVERVPEGGPAVVAWARRHRLPENDAPILAAAAAGDADFLVTGDRRHFGHLFGETVGGVQVVTLRDALRMASAP